MAMLKTSMLFYIWKYETPEMIQVQQKLIILLIGDHFLN